MRPLTGSTRYAELQARSHPAPHAIIAGLDPDVAARFAAICAAEDEPLTRPGECECGARLTSVGCARCDHSADERGYWGEPRD